jgi:predicted acylesterase/phospholipase RssA
MTELTIIFVAVNTWRMHCRGCGEDGAMLINDWEAVAASSRSCPVFPIVKSYIKKLGVCAGIKVLFN